MIIGKMQEDVTTALKAGERDKVDTLRFALADLKNKAIEKHGDLEDSEVVSAMAGMIKKLNDSIVQFETAGRAELVALYKKQVAILQEYLPEEIGDEELKKIVGEVVEKNIVLKDNLGALIGKAVAELKGKASPARIAEMIKQQISS